MALYKRMRVNELQQACETQGLDYHGLNKKGLIAGIVSSGSPWERRSQSYFDSGNGVPRNAIVRQSLVTLL